jgi:hypothetical protein
VIALTLVSQSGTIATSNAVEHPAQGDEQSLPCSISGEDVAHQKVKQYWQDRRRERIERLKAAGLCTMCGTNKARKNRVTCADCSEAGTKRKQLSRKAKDNA